MLLEALYAVLAFLGFKTKGDYQDNVIQYMHDRELAGKGGLLVLGCGFGKTLMAIAMYLSRIQSGQKQLKTLWVTQANLVVQVRQQVCKFLEPKQLQHKVVILDTPQQFNEMQPDSIGVISCTRLEKLRPYLEGAEFERVMAGRLATAW